MEPVCKQRDLIMLTRLTGCETGIYGLFHRLYALFFPPETNLLSHLINAVSCG